MTYNPNPKNIGWSDSKAELIADVQKAPWFARAVLVSAGCSPKQYGTWFGNEGDRRVTVSFMTADGTPREWSLSKFERPLDNLWALRIGLNSIRLNELRGLGDVVREMYLALPAPTNTRDPFEVLGVRPDSPAEVIDAAYRALSRTAHPDKGGSTEAFKALTAAYEAVKR